MVRPPSTTRISQNSWDASLNASRLRPSCNNSVNTGTNAAPSADCANRLLNRLGICDATVNAEIGGEVLKKAAWVTSRARPAIRDNAVAPAKIAVLTEIRRRGGLTWGIWLVNGPL